MDYFIGFDWLLRICLDREAELREDYPRSIWWIALRSIHPTVCVSGQ